MAIYSWQLTLVVIAIYLPIIPILKAIQQQQFLKYREVREAVSETLGQASEAVTDPSYSHTDTRTQSDQS